MRRALAALVTALLACFVHAAVLAKDGRVASPAARQPAAVTARSATPPGQRPAASTPAPAGARRAAAPAAVVQAFYAFHFAHDMAFTRATVRARSRWFSPELLEHIRAYFARPDEPGEVPAIDGDPFTDSQEYPRTFRVGAATVTGDTARVPVAMVWPEGERRVVTVLLVPVHGAWRFLDVRYSRGEPSLRELLDHTP